MKKIIISLLGIVVMGIILTGCSNEDEDEIATPEERFDTYIEAWNKQNFSNMYELLSEETTGIYQNEDFIDSHQDIYSEIDVENLTISYESMDEEELNDAVEDGEAEINFSVEMDTVGGPIDFDYTAVLTKEGETVDDQADWFINWDPGFIFPELKDGGKVEVKTLNPERGNIYDRNGDPLATNDTIHEIGVVPQQMDEETSKKKIAELLDIDEDTIDSKLDQEWVEPDLYVPLKKVQGASENTIGELGEVKGVSIREVTGRVYPLNEAAAHLIGYIGQIQADELEELEEEQPGVYSSTDLIGKRGLEQLYEKELRGEKGTQVLVTYENQEDDGDGDTNEDVVLAEKPVQDGKDFTLTIDMDIQKEIYKGFKSDDEAGTAAAIDPKTGETLALVSSPSFNPNDRLYGMSADEWEKISEDKDNPLLNRFVATFAPGSSIKPITAAIGIKNGTIDPAEKITIQGKEWSNGESWGNYTVKRVSTSNEHVDLADALIESDNIYFAMQAVNMGGDKFVDGLKAFGFGEDMPFEYPMETSTVSASGALDEEVLLANAGYGQGEIQISALHLASTYTTFINDGKMLKPTLLKSEDTEEVWNDDLITADEAKMIRDDLRQVVKSSNGTAQKAQEADFPISGKTGTAELKRSGEESGQENGWFVGYPSDEQDIIIAMMIEHTEDKGGSSYTVEKVTDILQELKK
ncbi:MAG TPA: penicillin-binding transpeptidase domain-containing protein [Bacillota bacterium]|nr:penicillin-binding transpeptidase domain-containing protein [Bacillota bacterium]